MNTRKAKRTRHSARMDGCTPELNAAFAIIPPTPKNAAAVSAKEYPSPSRNGAAAGSTEGPRALGCRPRRPRPGGPRREERVSVDRSEEHTSELQSPDQLVCRLL